MNIVETGFEPEEVPLSSVPHGTVVAAKVASEGHSNDGYLLVLDETDEDGSERMVATLDEGIILRLPMVLQVRVVEAVLRVRT